VNLANFPSYVPAGDYYVGIKIDSGENITESNELNNTAFDGSYPLTVTAPSLPDLHDRGDAYSWFNPVTVSAGDGFYARFDVENGGVATTTWFRVDFYASADTTITQDDYYLDYGLVPGLAAGGTAPVAISLSGGFPDTIPSGAYYVGIIIDTAGAVTESNEGNNTGVDLDYYPLTVTDAQAPMVEHVLVKGSGWTDGFLDTLDLLGLGHPTETRLGYRIPDGPAQLDVLPWGNVDTISIGFSEDVDVEEGDLALWGVNVADYVAQVGFAPGSFSYNSATFTATWTLAQPIGADKLLIDLDGDTGGVTDAAGNVLLDGEWQNGVSTVSGNNEPGGDFRFRLNVLPGDVDQSGEVDDLDASILGAHWHQQADATWEMGDFNGDGKVNDKDAAILAAHWGMQLPEAAQPPVSSPVSDTPDRPTIVGPQPLSAVPATRRRLSDPREAAREAVFAEASGYSPTRQQRLAAAWSYEMARSHVRERLTAPADRLAARRAVDLLMSAVE
jgi:hypothetical protein